MSRPWCHFGLPDGLYLCGWVGMMEMGIGKLFWFLETWTTFLFEGCGNDSRD